MFWILMSVGIATLVYFAFIEPFNYWAERGVSQARFWTTWKEIILDFMQHRSIAEAVQKMYDDFPGSRYSGVYQFYTPALSVRDPDLIKQITVKDFDHFVDHWQFVPEDSEPLWERNLVSLRGNTWRDMRATLSPSFTSNKMKIMFGLISEAAQRFASYFEEQNLQVATVEMKDAFTRFANDVIGSTSFGVVCDSLRDRDNDFYLMGKQVTDFTGFWKNIKFMFTLMAPGLSKKLGVKFFDERASNFFRELVEGNIQIREKEGIVRPDMIHLLMEARKGREKSQNLENMNEGYAVVEESLASQEEGYRKEQLTNEDITAQALLFFFAGFETVSTLMCFMAYELAVNPDVQQILKNEVDDVLTDCGGSVNYEALSKMRYMDMVVSETLRKWPSAVITDRVCTKPYTIQPSRTGEKPVHLKKGDLLILPVFGMQRDPRYFPNPDRFDPERFSDENKAHITPYSFAPFGSGPRSCVGNRFALMETKLVFFHILAKFEITVVEKTPVPLKLAPSTIQMTAEGGFWLGLQRRGTSL